MSFSLSPSRALPARVMVVIIWEMHVRTSWHFSRTQMTRWHPSLYFYEALAQGAAICSCKALRTDPGHSTESHRPPGPLCPGQHLWSATSGMGLWSAAHTSHTSVPLSSSRVSGQAEDSLSDDCMCTAPFKNILLLFFLGIPHPRHLSKPAPGSGRCLGAASYLLGITFGAPGFLLIYLPSPAHPSTPAVAKALPTMVSTPTV